jgi:hypothetical protein
LLSSTPALLFRSPLRRSSLWESRRHRPSTRFQLSERGFAMTVGRGTAF